MDILVIKAIADELNDQLVSSRISKVYQVNAFDLVIRFWGRGEKRLYISVHPDRGRLHLTEHKPHYPPAPLRFAAYLRSHLTGARLVDVSVVPFDRIVDLKFQRQGCGETVEAFHLIVELLGRHGNVIVTDADHAILEALRHVSARESSIRQVVPGERYAPLPPLPRRLSLADIDREELLKRLSTPATEEKDAPASLPQRLRQWIGLGPSLSQELSLCAIEAGPASSGQTLWTALEEWRTRYRSNRFAPQILRLQGGEEVLSALDLPHLPIGSRQLFQDMNQAADAFYGPRLEAETLRETRHQWLRFLEKEAKRLARKRKNLEGDRRKLEGYLKLKEYGDLLISQQASATRGASSARLINYYSPDMGEIEVPLDVRLSPKENAETFYKKYRKARDGLSVVDGFLARAQADLDYLDDLAYQAEEAEDLEALLALGAEIREARGKKASAVGSRKPRRADAPQEKKDELSRHCRRFVSSDGWEILCGKSHHGNEWLLKRVARAEDIWLHAHGLPGAHVLLRRGSSPEIPARTLIEAAQIAAYFSRGKSSTKVSVDYTPARNVRKLPRGRPGQVTLSAYQTVLVRPEPMRSEE